MLGSGRENPGEMFSGFNFPTETLFRVLSIRLELAYDTVKY